MTSRPREASRPVKETPPMTSTPPDAGRTATAPLSPEDLETALNTAISTVRRNIAVFGGAYPDDTTLDGRYPLRPAHPPFPEGGNRGWTTSFWPGMQWIAWEVTGEAE